MNKTLVEVIVVLVLAATLGGVAYIKKPKAGPAALSLCPTDVMMCPDGSSVPRAGSKCEFGVCAQELPKYMQPDTQAEQPITPLPTKSETLRRAPSIPKPSSPKKQQVEKTTPSKIVEALKQAASKVSKSVTSLFENPKNQNNQVTPTQNIYQVPVLDETRLSVKDNTIVNASGTVIYTLPPTGSGGTSSSSWETHVVNVVPVNQIVPVVGAIPVDGVVGKYYLSENSFGNMSLCEFSNRIYILDTIKNTKVLMYEENNTNLTSDDLRACTSEMFLLATEGERLILKYHTVGTNMTCDSTWSEPEKTWYITVTNPSSGTFHYPIPNNLYAKSEQEEAQCRPLHEATSTAIETVSG